MADAASGGTAKAAPTFTSPPLGRPTIPSGSLLLRLHQEAARGGRPPASLASLRGGGRPKADGCDPPPPPPKDDDLRSMLEHSKIQSQREQREKGGPAGLWGDALEAKLKMVARERVVDMAEEEEARRRAHEEAFEHISREGIEIEDEQEDKRGCDEDAADGREGKRGGAEEEVMARMMAGQGIAAANVANGGAEAAGEGNSRDSSEDGQPGGGEGIQTRECDDLMWEAAEEVGFPSILICRVYVAARLQARSLAQYSRCLNILDARLQARSLDQYSRCCARGCLRGLGLVKYRRPYAMSEGEDTNLGLQMPQRQTLNPVHVGEPCSVGQCSLNPIPKPQTPIPKSLTRHTGESCGA